MRNALLLAFSLLVFFAPSSRSQTEEDLARRQEAQLIFLVDELLHRADDDRASEIEKAILGMDDLSWTTLFEVMRRPMPRTSMEPGLIEKRRRLGLQGIEYETFVQVPEGYDPKRFWPLLVTVHGTGGEGRGPLEAMIAPCKEHGVIIASVSETVLRRSQGWGYSAEERQVLYDLIRSIKSEYQIDPRRVYMNGWSRGGHASWDIALRYPSLLAGIGPIVGAVPSRDLTLAPNLIGVRIDAVNGALDQPELVQAMEDVGERLRALGAEFRGLMDPERGHGGFDDRLGPMVDHLLDFERAVAPRRIAISSYEKKLVRNDWLEIATFDRQIYEPGEKITIPGVNRMNPEQRRRAWLDHIDEHTAKLEARVEEGNKIVLEAHKVKRAKILLPPSGIDLEAPVEIWCGEKRLRRSHFKPSLKALLKSLRASGDPFQAYPAEVELSIR